MIPPSSKPVTSTFLSRAQSYWRGIPLWAIVLTTAFMVYLSIGPVEAMIFHGDWPLPRAEDIKLVEGRFISGGGRRSPYRLQTGKGDIVPLACMPEAASAECLASLGYSARSLPGRAARIEYYHVRNYEYPAMTNIMVSSVIDGKVTLDREKGLRDLAMWKTYSSKFDWTEWGVYLAIACPAWLMLGTAWIAKLSRRTPFNSDNARSPY